MIAFRGTILLVFALLAFAAYSEDLPCHVGPRTTRAYSVISSNSIAIHWPTNEYRIGLWLARREYVSPFAYGSWNTWTTNYTNLSTPSYASSYTDTNISDGTHYEYQIVTLITNYTCDDNIGDTSRPYWVYQHINTGVNVPVRDAPGNLILLAETGITNSLVTELSRLEQDFVGDGYKVTRLYAAAKDVTEAGWNTNVTNIKTAIKNVWLTDTNAQWTLFIVGHVPIPYSGLSSPGGHTDNYGAHPADWFYADMDDASWTDTTANDSTGAFAAQHNVPGDGKFDQVTSATVPEMRFGRIDLRNMPDFSDSEVELLRQYLDRNHAWRHKEFTVRDLGLINSNNNAALVYRGQPYDSHNHFSGFFGSDTNIILGSWLIHAASTNNSYLMASSSGNGEYDRDDQIGYSADFAATNLYVAFPTLFGSYYGDWDSAIITNALLQATLASSGYTLAVYYHEYEMNIGSSAMGLPVGDEMFALRATTSVDDSVSYHSFGYVFGGETYVIDANPYIYTSLLGDPTLRMRVVAPPTDATFRNEGADNIVEWTAASDTGISGYNVYRAPSTNLNDFSHVGTNVSSGFRDTGASSGDYTYMVRTVKLVESDARSYYDESQGAFATEYTAWYVDSSATGGTGTGTGWANAWTNMTKVTWGGAGVTAGETLFVSGGSSSKTYTNTWIMDASGTAGNPITIRVGQDSGHSGYVMFDGAVRGDAFSGYMAYLGNYVVLDGSVQGQAKMLFSNIVNSSNKDTGQAVYRDGATVGTIRYVIFTNINNCVLIGYNTNSYIHNCSFYARGDSAVKITQAGTGYDQVQIYSNIFNIWVDDDAGTPSGPDAIQCPSGVSVFNNTFQCISVPDSTPYGQHPDFIQFVGRWFKFYNNRVINVGDSGLDIESLTGAEGIKDIKIYNNIFEQNEWLYAGPEFIRSYAVDNQPVFYQNYHVLNNVFLCNSNLNTCSVLMNADFANAGNDGTNNWIANNIWVNCSSYDYNTMFGILGTASNPSVWRITNNVYCPSPGAAGHVQYHGTIYSAADWIASYDPAGNTNQPTFVSYTAHAEDNDYHLQAGDTVALDKGLNFSDIFTTDADGNTRSGTWDIGPYESAGGSEGGAAVSHRVYGGRISGGSVGR